MTEQKNKALVFDIQSYSIHDGPGIRTLVFLKGCPLRCRWCCNPESQAAAQEVEFHKDLCTGCGRCAAACPRGAVGAEIPGSGKYKIDKGLCQGCGACARACPSGALRVVGRWASASEIMAEIKKDVKFFRRSGGGVTLSGGEPLIWADFCGELLRECYDGNLHTAVETTGCVPAETIDRVKDYVDLFLYDIKSVDPERHKELTGVSNDLILGNLRRLRQDGRNVVMRIPLIPGENFFRSELEGMLRLADEMGIEEVHLMPYHDLGRVKYERLSRPYALEGTAGLKFAKDLREQLEPFQDIFGRYNRIAVLIGG